MTSWEDVTKTVESSLKSRITYAKITTVRDIAGYLNEQTAQALFDQSKDFIVLLSPPEGDTQNAESRIGGWFRRRYDIAIAVVSKADPQGVPRLYGPGSKKGIFDLRDEIVSILEHSNLGGLVDNKAGVNFETGWVLVPTDNKAITVYQTIYTAIKTEK